jgi:hypothetical protein
MSWHNQKDEERGQSQHYSPDRDLEKRPVSCLNAFGLSENRSSKAATCADIRELFVEDSLGLYLLSFLLTADQKKAERCFIASPDECINGNSSFHQLANSWARCMIVRNALRMLTTNPGPCGPETAAARPATSLHDSFLARVLALENFERFVYVLSVLEEFPDRNCAVLLGVSPQRIRETRNCALKHIGHLDS